MKSINITTKITAYYHINVKKKILFGPVGEPIRFTSLSKMAKYLGISRQALNQKLKS